MLHKSCSFVLSMQFLAIRAWPLLNDRWVRAKMEGTNLVHDLLSFESSQRRKTNARYLAVCTSSTSSHKGGLGWSWLLIFCLVLPMYCCNSYRKILILCVENSCSWCSLHILIGNQYFLEVRANIPMQNICFSNNNGTRYFYNFS